MQQNNSTFLINLSLLTNNTYFALYKSENGIQLESKDLEDLKKFLEILASIKESIDEPYNNVQFEMKLLPLLNILNNTEFEQRTFNGLITTLKEIIDNKAKTTSDLIKFVQSFAESIDQLLDNERSGSSNELSKINFAYAC